MGFNSGFKGLIKYLVSLTQRASLKARTGYSPCRHFVLRLIFVRPPAIYQEQLQNVMSYTQPKGISIFEFSVRSYCTI